MAEVIYPTWSCRFCDQVFDDSDKAQRHAMICYYNPIMRSCDTCRHYNAVCQMDYKGDLITSYHCAVVHTQADCYVLDCDVWVDKFG